MNLIYQIIAVLSAIILHEFAHGYVSWKLGDPTPKTNGRLTLNPLKHLDLVGTICMFLFHFGWAKPVMVNPKYYKNQKLGMMIVASAGPITNFILALFCGFMISQGLLVDFFEIALMMNIGLCVFNLIPISPLDGSKIIAGILPDKLYFKLMEVEQYGFIILLIMLYSGVLSPVLLYLVQTISSIIYVIFGI